MAWRGSISRSLLATARSSSIRRSPPRPRARAQSVYTPRFQSRAFVYPRNISELGCCESLLPFHNVVASVRLTSHLMVNARAYCELSQGIFCRTCQDR